MDITRGQTMLIAILYFVILIGAAMDIVEIKRTLFSKICFKTFIISTITALIYLIIYYWNEPF